MPDWFSVEVAIIGVALVGGIIKMIVDLHTTKKGLDHVDACIHRIEKQLHGRISHMEERLVRVEDKLDKLLLELSKK